ncbi:hypothetical protein G9A89_017205 [Geosiphon pyriformis]|nr:hypothetical protein G9A89_017205 [Geosiphon pyriformis]
MVYALIAKLDNFTGEENDTQNTANSWYQSLVNKPQNFNAFKAEFLRYFSNNNSINCLVNIFTTMKQGETEAVTTYLGCFHQNLHQIQAINTNYFTAPQILNQFIHGLCSSILQHVCPLHPGTLQDAVTRARNFESAESETNYAQAVNLVMNRSSELDSKLEKFTTATDNVSTTTANNLLTPNNSNPATKLTSQQSPKTENYTAKLEIVNGARNPQNLNSQNYLSLLVTPEDASPSNQKPTQKQQTHTSNIPPATVTNNELLDTIFPFKLEKPLTMPLFSRAALEKKPITAMYTDVKIDGHHIKLILDSGSADSIITQQFMDQLGYRVDRTASTRIITADGATKTPIGKINDLPIEINGIIVPIKVLVMEAIQYQALVGNNWLSKTNATLNWNTQELQLSQNRQYTRVPATCSHFKATNTMAPLIDFEEKKQKPTWEAYQISWANEEHNELPSILSWDDNRKGKQTNKLTWETDNLTWTDNEQEEPSSWEWKKKKGKGKEREEENTQANNTYIPYTYACRETLLNEGMWNDILGRGGMYDVFCQYTILISNWVKKKTPIEATWRRAMAITKIEGALPKEIRTIKNNPPEPIELDWDAEPVINFLEPEEFHEHYQNLAPTREEQEQWLAQLNTRLCCHCLIPSNFEYCDDCNLIYNPPPCMIYTIPEEEKPISSCASESELLINCDSDFDNDDKNTSSSSIQNGNDNKDDPNSDSNSDLNYKQYIALSDLSKEQELKWYSDNGKGIMPECVHDTDAGFDLRYPGTEVIKLKPHTRTCIDLKVALEILATTMV